MSDENGTLLDFIAYTPYGSQQKLFCKPESNSLNYTFTDQEWDAETGLYNYDARLYDPVLGRFISGDSIVPDWYDPQMLDRYAYARNNPLKYTDPDGHAVETWLDIISLVDSAYSMATKPSWSNAGFLAWDVAGLIPFVPGSWSGKAVKYGSNLLETGTDLAKNADRVIDGTEAAVDASKSVRHGPMNPGPLADDIANTFRSGSYTARTVDKPTTMYRVISDTGNPTGSHWTSVKPKGPLQSVIDSALDQNWGNTATRVVKAEIPAGTKIYEGAAAAQRGLVGGGNQVYIPKVDPKWIVP